MRTIEAVVRSAMPGEPERLLALHEAIRAPLPLSTSVGVIGAGGPTALTGALLARALAHRGQHRVLAVAVGDEAEMLVHCGVEVPATPTEESIARRAVATSSGQATAGLARGRSGVWALDLGTRPNLWWDAVAPISRFFDFVITDWATPSDLDEVRAAATVMLVVVEAEPESLQAGVDLAARLPRQGPAPIVVARAGRRTAPGMRELAAANDALWLPTRGPASAGYRTERSALDLAAAVVGAAATRNRTGGTR